jgi:hypothetical protein
MPNIGLGALKPRDLSKVVIFKKENKLAKIGSNSVCQDDFQSANGLLSNLGIGMYGQTNCD